MKFGLIQGRNGGEYDIQKLSVISVEVFPIRYLTYISIQENHVFKPKVQYEYKVTKLH